MQPELRDYQADWVLEVGRALAAMKYVVGQAPTGAGKTVMFSFIAMGAMRKANRIIIVAHRKKICQQISDELTKFGVPHTRIQTGHPFHPESPVQVGMVMTVKSRIDRLRKPTILIIDEGHHSRANTYQVLLKVWQPQYVLSVSATPKPDPFFKALVHGPQIRWLVEQGWLARPIHIAPPPLMDLTGVGMVAGDYHQGRLGVAMNKATITGNAVEQYRKNLDRQPALAFCVTVQHARDVAAEFAAAGYRTAVIHGEQDEDEQNALLDDLGEGRLDVLCSCEMVGEGVSVPAIAGIIMLRPTKSIVVFMQQIGRALRMKSGRNVAIILDLVGNWKTPGFGLAEDHRIWELEKLPKAEPSAISQCQSCFHVFGTSAADWKKQATCGSDEAPRPRNCLLDARVGDLGAPRTPPKVVDGELTTITRYPEWAQGLNILEAKGRDWFRLLDLADTVTKLHQIAVARRFHKRWIAKVWQEKMKQAANRRVGHG